MSMAQGQKAIHPSADLKSVSLVLPTFDHQAHTHGRSFDMTSIRAAYNNIGTIPTFMKELIAGGVSGGFSKTVVAPLERTKLLYQTQNATFQSLGVTRTLLFIHKREGFSGFYRGNGAGVVRIVPYAALHFMAYEQYRRWIINYWPERVHPGALPDFMAGSLAGGTAVLFTYPLDLAMTTLGYQVRDPRTGSQAYTGIRDVFSKVVQANGLKGLYRGIGPTLCGIVPYAGLKFFVYESLKNGLSDELHENVFVKLACGGVAGMVGQTFTYPLDVVRRRMQVQAVGFSSQTYKGTLDGLVSIIRSHGVKQLFAGLSINYIKLVPSVAIGFTAYDIVKSWMGVPSREGPRES
ncbi:hypothetical protein KP509_32G012500 [Ceratopteris richardii]|uniref:Mitochondrial carrier protein n=1 Tax=Ceratopteris richardii TaxID=49495 RepID=A0A8T2QRQ0_CERRI|nr:hypothetical protein KP509_32G012500 [Ceratopteris richardii]KAH7286557.1 hypothetical protein KP509_32G012500 [Ceratopteris richardii]